MGVNRSSSQTETLSIVRRSRFMDRRVRAANATARRSSRPSVRQPHVSDRLKTSDGPRLRLAGLHISKRGRKFEPFYRRSFDSRVRGRDGPPGRPFCSARPAVAPYQRRQRICGLSPDVPASALGPRIVYSLHAGYRVGCETSGLGPSQPLIEFHQRAGRLRPRIPGEHPIPGSRAPLSELIGRLGQSLAQRVAIRAPSHAPADILR